MLSQSGRTGELFGRLANRTDDGLGIESERRREIKNAARIFVLSSWVDVAVIC